MPRAKGSGDQPPNVTDLLTAWAKGDRRALDHLVPVIHGELYRLARRQMAGERVGHTLQPTALVNEVFLRLVDLRDAHWENRSRFFALSARLMRQILVDAARARRGRKRGGALRRVLFDERFFVVDTRYDLVALDEALSTLATVDPRRAQVVELRFFGGLTVAETAQALQVSSDTVMRDWKLAKAWLLRELKDSPPDDR
jgi:RNA polymerase sigma factor (TIGR02999 family)